MAEREGIIHVGCLAQARPKYYEAAKLAKKSGPAQAALYSLVETGKTNGLEPYHYFRYLFTHRPAVTSKVDFKEFPPLKLKPTDLLDA